jgi:hypothetical protein
MYRRDQGEWERQDRGAKRVRDRPREWQPEPLRLPLYRPMETDSEGEREPKRRPAVIVIDPDDHPDLA